VLKLQCVAFYHILLKYSLYGSDAGSDASGMVLQLVLAGINS
jgi:hypothetical protein